jgi:hypothetical protein
VKRLHIDQIHFISVTAGNKLIVASGTNIKPERVGFSEINVYFGRTVCFMCF